MYHPPTRLCDSACIDILDFQPQPFNIQPGWSASSPSFGPNFEVSGTLPDITIVSGDRICYYAHSRFLLHSSTNAFGGLLRGTPPPSSLEVAEPGAALQIALHAIYRMPCAHLAPSLESTEGAIDALLAWGVDARALATPHSPLFSLVLAAAPRAPIEAYALAAHFRMDALAVAVSAHLLGFDTTALSDALALQMGPGYLRRLVEWHQMRLARLKEICLKPPAAHAPTPGCGRDDKGALMKAWAYASAGIVWEARPGTSAYQLRTSFEKAAAGVVCSECLTMLHARIEEVVQEWSLVPAPPDEDIPFGFGSLSQVFGPTFEFAGLLPDAVLVVEDQASFYVHSDRLSQVSLNAFGGLLDGTTGIAGPTFVVPESPDTLNITLRVVYELSCAHLSPSLDDIESVVNALIKYGIPLDSVTGSPDLPLHALILRHAPERPIEAYALAGHHGLESVAVAVSAHLLAYDTAALTNELALKMGAVYCRRLFMLHQDRLLALRRIVLRPPGTHRPTLVCGTGADGMGRLMRAWALVAAEVVWVASPGMSAQSLQTAFARPGRDIECIECLAMLRAHVQEVAREWSAVKVSIPAVFDVRRPLS
ncbi:uncharacterized protein BXZ73DRAFT_53189 [Epithele typhae]|uniref:uncharacterized protein n=1 Tax=Epithele typhae TaxID=378194 RepID=UPI002007CBFB|nr:uncharacterized protein BXZ73DRAFT_53189 [Epithele typhae]KAH9917930.1 hypothetical protein BXZ73DRAFT_53189 [Epithele typhae]